jgi:hypothetical protein
MLTTKFLTDVLVRLLVPDSIARVGNYFYWGFGWGYFKGPLDKEPHKNSSVVKKLLNS